MATPTFRKRLLKSYLCGVRLVRCEIFADSSLLSGLFLFARIVVPAPTAGRISASAVSCGPSCTVGVVLWLCHSGPPFTWSYHCL